MKIVIKDDDRYYNEEKDSFLYNKENATIFDADSWQDLENNQLLNKLKEKFKNDNLEIVEVKPKPSFDEILSKKKRTVQKATNEQVEYFTNFRGHKDSILALLTDPSLNHDMNAMLGTWRRSNEQIKNFEECFNLDFSDKVSNATYHDPNCEYISKYQLAYKARMVSLYFAKLADVFLTIEKHNEKILKDQK